MLAPWSETLAILLKILFDAYHPPPPNDHSGYATGCYNHLSEAICVFEYSTNLINSMTNSTEQSPLLTYVA